MIVATFFALFLVGVVLPCTVVVEDAKGGPVPEYYPLYPYSYSQFGVTFNDDSEGVNDGNIYARRNAAHTEIRGGTHLDGG